MIPADIRLYTWLNVEELLLANLDWPQALVWMRAYWDQLTLGIKPGTEIEIVIDWLQQIHLNKWHYVLYCKRFQIG